MLKKELKEEYRKRRKDEECEKQFVVWCDTSEKAR